MKKDLENQGDRLILILKKNRNRGCKEWRYLIKKKILKYVKDENVKFIRLWFTDILGFLKSFAITDTQLESAFEEGMGFDGSSI